MNATWILILLLAFMPSKLAAPNIPDRNARYNILVVIPSPFKSNALLGLSMVKLLTEAGHSVTFVTSYAPARARLLMNVIDVGQSTKGFDNGKFINETMNLKSILKDKVNIENAFTLMTKLTEITKLTVHNSAFQNMLRDKNKKYDLIIAEWMFNEALVGLSAIFKCPFIWLSTMGPHWRVLRLIDGMPNPAYTTDPLLESILPLTFVERVQGLTNQLYETGFEVLASQKEIYITGMVPHITMRGSNVPRYYDLTYNASMVLGCNHVSLGQPARLPENYKSIGGYHIHKKLEFLNSVDEKLLNDSRSGVIYFSMGADLESKTLPHKIKKGLLHMFSQLNQTVLWKLEERWHYQSKNIYTVDWFPQKRILAHKKCVLFITTGGIMSMTEAVHFGVPIIGIPIFRNQFSNVNLAVAKGFAKRIDYSEGLVEGLKNAIKEVLSNPTYKKKAMKYSLISNDRLTHPSDELIYWIEHVIRTRGAKHLESPSLFMEWYKRWFLDLVIVIIVFVFLIRSAIRLLFNIYESMSMQQDETEAKRK